MKFHVQWEKSSAKMAFHTSDEESREIQWKNLGYEIYKTINRA